MEVGGEEAIVAGLQLWQLPIVAGDLSAAQVGAAATDEFVVGGAVTHGVINAHFFTGLNVAQGDKGNRTAQAQIGIARVIDIISRVWFAHVGHLIQIVFYLHAVLLLKGVEAGKLFFGDDVTAPTNNQLALSDGFTSK